MKSIFITILLFSSLWGFSQAVIHFERQAHDFGSIKEVEGPVTYDFVFTNKGNAPVIIKNVESSCGCTAPEWTRQPVLPGKTGFVKAIFDPKDRPGYFDKTLTIHSNAQNSVMELKIKGNVESKVRTVLDDYPYELPSGIRLPFDHISLMTAKKGEVKKMAVKIYNNAGKDIRVQFNKLPEYLKINSDPALIKAKNTAVFNVEYHTAMHGEYGLNRTDVQMSVDGKNEVLPVSIFIEEDFSGVNSEQSPVITVDKRTYNFGSISKGQSASVTYKVSNTGKSLLKIHRYYSNDDKVELELVKRELLPGETADLLVRTKPGVYPGTVSATISLISNSPLNSELKVRFYGEIISEK